MSGLQIRAPGGYRGTMVNDPVEVRRRFPCNSDFHEQLPQAGPVNVRLHVCTEPLVQVMFISAVSGPVTV